jgi:hypothetical protein
MRLLTIDEAANFNFLLVDSADHRTGKTGLSPTVVISKDGGAFASIDGSVAEIAYGWYKAALTANDLDTLGEALLHITASGADTADYKMQVVTKDIAGTADLTESQVRTAVWDTPVASSTNTPGEQLKALGDDIVSRANTQTLAGLLDVPDEVGATLPMATWWVDAEDAAADDDTMGTAVRSGMSEAYSRGLMGVKVGTSYELHFIYGLFTDATLDFYSVKGPFAFLASGGIDLVNSTGVAHLGQVSGDIWTADAPSNGGILVCHVATDAAFIEGGVALLVDSESTALTIPAFNGSASPGATLDIVWTHNRRPLTREGGAHYLGKTSTGDVRGVDGNDITDSDAVAKKVWEYNIGSGGYWASDYMNQMAGQKNAILFKRASAIVAGTIVPALPNPPTGVSIAIGMSWQYENTAAVNLNETTGNFDADPGWSEGQGYLFITVATSGQDLPAMTIPVTVTHQDGETTIDCLIPAKTDGANSRTYLFDIAGNPLDYEYGSPAAVPTNLIPPTVEEIDAELGANHGNGAWGDSAGANAWDEDVDDHLTAGTFGALANSLAREATLMSQIGTGVVQGYITVTTGNDINVYRGDASPLTFSLGTGWNLTGKKVFLCVKKSKNAADGTAIVNRECAVVDAAAGIATITLTTAETATADSYYYDVEVRDTDGNNPRTWSIGAFNILEDVRRG